MAKYDEFGREIPDQTPVELPLHFKRPKPLAQLVQDLVRTELSKQASAQGQESFDEANDFYVEDEDFPVSPHEMLDDEDFAIAEQNLLDRAARDMDNERTVNSDRIKESGNGKAGSVGNAGSGERSSDDGEKRKSVGGEGGSTGRSKVGVSEGEE